MKSYPTRDEAVTEITKALGMAFSHWQTIEFNLFLLYRNLCGDLTVDQRKVTEIVYNSMPLESKITALAGLIKHRTPMDKKYMQDWDLIAKQFNKQKRLRDKMAHWSILSTPKPAGYYAFLAPPLSDLDRVVKASADPENSEAISAETLFQRSTEDFGKVSAAIEAFSRNLPARA
jgi:hypothetical protein